MEFYKLLLTSVVINVTGNILLKKGVISFGGISSDKSQLIYGIAKAAVNPFILTGLALYSISFVIWLRVLTFNDLSKSYPIFASMVFLLTTIGSIRFLNETVSSTRILGIIIMLIGIFVVARS